MGLGESWAAEWILPQALIPFFVPSPLMFLLKCQRCSYHTDLPLWVIGRDRFEQVRFMKEEGFFYKNCVSRGCDWQLFGWLVGLCNPRGPGVFSGALCASPHCAIRPSAPGIHDSSTKSRESSRAWLCGTKKRRRGNWYSSKEHFSEGNLPQTKTICGSLVSSFFLAWSFNGATCYIIY